MIHVLDASAVIAYFREESGCEAVKAVLRSGASCFLHSVN